MNKLKFFIYMSYPHFKTIRQKSLQYYVRKNLTIIFRKWCNFEARTGCYKILNLAKYTSAKIIFQLTKMEDVDHSTN